MPSFTSTSPKLPGGYRLLKLEAVDSTNAEARRRSAAGEPGPLWVWSARQSAGRGRAGDDATGGGNVVVGGRHGAG